MALKPIALALIRSRRRKSGSCGNLQADRAAVARVRAAEVDPPAVEAEGAVRESGNRGSRSGPICSSNELGPRSAEPGRDAVQEGIVQFPQLRVGDAQFASRPRSRRRAARGRAAAAASVSPPAAGRNGQLQPAAAAVRRRVVDGGLHADHARLPVGPHEEVGDADRRRDQQLHRIHDAALVPGAARRRREGPCCGGAFRSSTMPSIG